MDVTYFAVRSFDNYSPGDIIPGAGVWPAISLHVAEGRVAPVLVATLPEAVQADLAEWEANRDAEQAAAQAIADERNAAKRAARNPQPVEPEEAEDDDEDGEPPAELSYDELKAKATELELEFPGNVSKVDLIAMIETAEAEAAEGTTNDEE